MISFLAILLIISILLLTLTQTVLVIRYTWFHRNPEPETGLDTRIDRDHKPTNFPKAAIILCLRGEEESTPECVAELVGQDYGDYELHIAFDSKNDPAAAQVQAFFENHTAEAKLHFFEPKLECSYKCSGIVHVLEQLGDDIEIVAFCDGDAIVDATWLHDLVLPMVEDETIGATTGNRWFAPFDDAIGARVRKHWNAAAVVQMQAYDIAWGGSMAVRRSTIEKCNLMERWSKAFCEDTLLTDAMQQQSLKLHRVPDLVIENKETTNVPDCFSWIARQLLTVRLHHRLWPLVMAHGISTGLATIVAPLAIVLLLATGYFYEFRSLLIAWVIYQVLNFVLLKVIERCNRSAIDHRQRFSQPASPTRKSTSRWLSLLYVQILHPLAALKTMTMKSVSWRGVEYAIENKQLRVRGK